MEVRRVRVVFITAVPITKLFAWGGRGGAPSFMEKMSLKIVCVYYCST
jgi:hypothetical protein